MIQTICATGIRVSELQFITAEVVQYGQAEVRNKGKRRAVFPPDEIRGISWNLRTKTGGSQFSMLSVRSAVSLSGCAETGVVLWGESVYNGTNIHPI